jgi:adenine-specific DNA-methyltransferase
MIKDNLDFNQSVKPNTEFLEQLLQKLPEFFTSSDSDKEAEFDMEKFQKALKEQNVEELSSGYQLDFIGKNYAKETSRGAADNCYCSR